MNTDLYPDKPKFKTLTYLGETKTYSEWLKEYPWLTQDALRYRLSRKWPLQKIFTTPIHKKSKIWKTDDVREHLKRLREVDTL